ncbi:MAG: hypothetical protein JO237_04485 [Pseudolabrys sp.]|nr:hypothetical protein [Pseudolabrys sp.]
MARTGNSTLRVRAEQDIPAGSCSARPTLFDQEKVPKDEPITFADLAGKFTVLRAVCPKCDAEWNYPVRRLIGTYGRDTNVTDWLDSITADCPNRNNVDKGARCAVAIPALS